MPPAAAVVLQPTDLLRMERIILNVLDFGLSGPSCYTFLHLLAQVRQPPQHTTAASTSCSKMPSISHFKCQYLLPALFQTTSPACFYFVKPLTGCCSEMVKQQHFLDALCVPMRGHGPHCCPSLRPFPAIVPGLQVCSGVVTPAVLSLAMYLCELSMLDACTLSFSYSTKAAAALLLAQISLGAPMHTPAMESAVSACMGAGGPQGLTPCMTVLLRLQQIAYEHTASAVASATAAAAAADAARMDMFSTAVMSGGSADSAGAHGGARVAGLGLGVTAVGATPAPPATAVGSEDLLSPLRIKFGGDCWCNVSTALPMVLA
jgi:hypothetical protein